MSYCVKYFCVSHTGKSRKINQDNFYCPKQILDTNNYINGHIIYDSISAETEPIFGIFDGMGGEECGEVASQIAANILKETKIINPEEDLISYCKNANKEICKYTSEHYLTSMGTTAAILFFSSQRIYQCNIGDSKIFRITDKKLRQISYDHISISVYGTKPPLYQNLGIKESELTISPYIATNKYRSGDIYLICSDGLTDMIPIDEIEQIILSSDKDSAVSNLLNKALDNGGKDNITILLFYIESKFTKWLSKMHVYFKNKCL